MKTLATKRTTVCALSCMGILLAASFALVNLYRGLLGIAALEATVALFFATNLALIIRTHRLVGPSIAGILVSACMLLVVGNVAGMHAYFWIYPLPVLAFFLLGMRLGSWINAVLVMAFTVGLLVNEPRYVPLHLVELDIIVSFMVVVLLALLYERQRVRHMAELRRLSNVDPLTGALNRRQLPLLLGGEIKRAARYRSPLSLIMFDVDHYKQVNDRYGHQVGDEVLEIISTLVAANIRESDTLVRYGGDEFLVVAPGADMSEAHSLAEKLRTLALNHAFDGPERVTLSLGVAEWAPEVDSHEFLKAVDYALYQAKDSGRNQVHALDVALMPGPA